MRTIAAVAVLLLAAGCQKQGAAPDVSTEATGAGATDAAAMPADTAADANMGSADMGDADMRRAATDAAAPPTRQVEDPGEPVTPATKPGRP